MKIISFIPNAELFGENTAQEVANALKATFQKRYTFQLLIWVLLHKFKKAIELFLADPENQHVANLAAKRASKAGTTTVAGCTFSADHLNTASYDYDVCQDPTLQTIYDAKASIHNLEVDREDWLKNASLGDKKGNFDIVVTVNETDIFSLKKKPTKTEHFGVRVVLPDSAL